MLAAAPLAYFDLAGGYEESAPPPPAEALKFRVSSYKVEAPFKLAVTIVS